MWDYFMGGEAGEKEADEENAPRLVSKNWLGTTIPHSCDESGEEPGCRWDEGDASLMAVRQPPNYSQEGLKGPSESPFYRCVSVDVVRHPTEVVREVLGHQPLPDCTASRGGDLWTPGCGLPRVICIVVMLPYTVGLGDSLASDQADSSGSSADLGCSVVSLHLIENSTMKMLDADTPSGALDLLWDFVQRRDCPAGDKFTSGALKAVAHCTNVEDLNLSYAMSAVVDQYNGTPALISQSGRLRRDPSKNFEWLEISFDVRLWSFPARSALYSLRDSTKEAIMQVGMVVQGTEDEELPEQLFALCRVHFLDFERTPALICEDSQMPNPASFNDFLGAAPKARP